MKNLLPILAVVFVLVAITVAVSVGIAWRMSGPLKQSIGVILVYEVDPALVDMGEPVDMDKLIAAVDRRINPGGTRRGRIRPRGVDQIEIGVYGNDPKMVERIESLLETVGTLEFRILANRRDHGTLIRRAESEKETNRFHNETDGQLLAWWVPITAGNKDAFQYPEILTRTREAHGQERLEVLVVDCGFGVTGEYLSRATPDVDQRGMPCLSFVFNSQGAQLFGGLTSSNLPDLTQNFTRKLGIIVNGQVASAPAIQCVIFDRGQITGSFTKEEVQDLADILNAGALPVAIRQVERRAVTDIKRPQLTAP